jgi:hypothetical protein
VRDRCINDGRPEIGTAVPFGGFSPRIGTPTKRPMSRVDELDVLECPHCGTTVYIGPFRESVSCVVREADEYGPRAFLIIAKDRLAHRCRLPSSARECSRSRLRFTPP